MSAKYSDDYLEGLAVRGFQAAKDINGQFKDTHPGGTLEAETIREMAAVIVSMKENN